MLPWLLVQDPLKDIGVELVHDVPSFHQEEQPHSSEVFCQHECCVQQSHHCPRCPNVSFLHKRLNAVLKYGGQWFMERATCYILKFLPQRVMIFV